jgi:hypothetical protein
MNKLIKHVVDGINIGDLVMDIIEIRNMKKEHKKHLRLIIGTHIALSALAVGVSFNQTSSIKKEIREYSDKKVTEHWG